jgi:hypothetical protein
MSAANTADYRSELLKSALKWRVFHSPNMHHKHVIMREEERQGEGLSGFTHEKPEAEPT